MDRLSLASGAAAGRAIDSKVKAPGVSNPAELAQVQKAVEYLSVRGSAKGTGASSLKLGETRVIDSVSTTRVGRWMSPNELAQMQSSNKVAQGGGGQTFISTNGAADFKGATPNGSVYVEFDVPSSSLLQGGKDGWFKMIGPEASKSQQYMLNKQGGSHLPDIKNIEILDKK